LASVPDSLDGDAEVGKGDLPPEENREETKG